MSRTSSQTQLEWKARLARQAESGINTKQWCKENGVAYSSFYAWKKKLGPSKQIKQSSFKELTDTSPASIEINYYGARVVLPANFDGVALRRFLGAIKSC